VRVISGFPYLSSAAFGAAIIILTSSPAIATTFPDPRLTPGATVPRITAAQVCTPGYASSVRPRGHEWYELKNETYARYGIARGHHYGFVGDHLVPIELGGAPDSVDNVWPQPYQDAHEKDYYEDALHLLVCDGRMSLEDAQRRIVNWPHALDGITLTADERRRLERMTSENDY
jgi:hypothetical protein